MRAHDCRPGKSHLFNRISGWCDLGCGNREDGRITTRHGDVIAEGPTYDHDQLDYFRARAKEAAS